eukprot:523748-Prymnesium_polylepis.1
MRPTGSAAASTNREPSKESRTHQVDTENGRSYKAPSHFVHRRRRPQSPAGSSDLVAGGRATDSLGAEPVSSDEDQCVSLCSPLLPSAWGCPCLPWPAQIRQHTGIPRAAILALHRAVRGLIDFTRQPPSDAIVRRCTP